MSTVTVRLLGLKAYSPLSFLLHWENVATSFYSSIVRLVGSYYLGDPSPKVEIPPSFPGDASFAYADILNRWKTLA